MKRMLILLTRPHHTHLMAQYVATSDKKGVTISRGHIFREEGWWSTAFLSVCL